MGAIFMPLLIATSFLWATWDSSSRLHEQQAAIVNLDEGAQVGTDMVRLGQTYALQLRNQTGPNFTWRYGVSVEEAEAGLASGRFAAAVVIPAGFSRALTGDPKGDDTATLVIERSPVSGVSDQIVLNTLSEAATQGLAKGVATKYLDNIYVETAELGAGLAETSAKAQEVATGVGQVAEDARTAATQSGTLTRQAEAAAKSAGEVNTAAASDVAGQRTNASRQGEVNTAGAGVQKNTDAQSKAIAELGTSAGELAGQADEAKKSSGAVAKDATGAASQGGAAAKQAEAVSKAAAANKAAATNYTGKVGSAVAQQADLQGSLGEAQKAFTQYVTNVQTVSKAVTQATQVLSAAGSAPSSSATVAPTAPSTTAPSANAPEGLVASGDLRTIANQLRAAAQVLDEEPVIDAEVKTSAARAAAQAGELKGRIDALRAALPTRQIKMDNGLGQGCPDGSTPQECRAYKQGYENGYNVAVALVNAALDKVDVNGLVDTLVSDTTKVNRAVADYPETRAGSSSLLRRLAGQLDRLADENDQATPVPDPDPTDPTPPTDTPAQAAVTAAAQALTAAPVKDALGALNQGATGTSQQMEELGTSLAENSRALAEVDATSDAATALSTGAQTMTTVSAEQAKTIEALQTTLTTLNKGMATLSQSLTTIDQDAADLSTRTTKVDDGASALAQQVTQLNTRLGALQQAAQASAEQAAATHTKAQALQQQVSALQQASSTVQTTVTGVSTSAATQAGNASRVVEAVKKNQRQVPTTSVDERQRLTEVINTPISTRESEANRNVGWTSMLMAIALWCGSIVYFSVRPSVSHRAKVSADRSAVLLAKEMLPTGAVAVAQALLLAVVGQSVLHLSASRALAMTGVLVLGALVAAASNHALRAFLGGIGIAISIALATLTFVSVVTAAYPVALDNVRRLAPTTPMVDALRAAMSGASGVGSGVWHLFTWLAIGVLFSALAILRARTGPEKRVPSVLAQDPPTEVL